MRSRSWVGEPGSAVLLTAGLAREGIQARGFTADVLDLDSLDAVLYAAAGTLGPIEIPQYSPVPRAFVNDAGAVRPGRSAIVQQFLRDRFASSPSIDCRIRSRGSARPKRPSIRPSKP